MSWTLAAEAFCNLPLSLLCPHILPGSFIIVRLALCYGKGMTNSITHARPATDSGVLRVKHSGHKPEASAESTVLHCSSALCRAIAWLPQDPEGSKEVDFQCCSSLSKQCKCHECYEEQVTNCMQTEPNPVRNQWFKNTC